MKVFSRHPETFIIPYLLIYFYSQDVREEKVISLLLSFPLKRRDFSADPALMTFDFNLNISCLPRWFLQKDVVESNAYTDSKSSKAKNPTAVMG